MSLFSYLGKDIYYTINGSGKPMILLNGIMMSTTSWEPFVNSLSKDNSLIRVDFIDQGRSSKVDFKYNHQVQIDLVKALLDHLEIKKVSIIGISYGGEVALGFATSYQEYIDRLVLFNTAAYTSPWLKDIGRSWIAVGRTRDGEAYYNTTIPIIYSQKFYEEHNQWMRLRQQKLNVVFSNPEFLDALERLTLSSESYNVSDKLDKIIVPTLIVAAEDDSLTPVINQIELNKLIKSSLLVNIPDCGHASMYEKPLLFTSLVLGFVNAEDINYKI